MKQTFGFIGTGNMGGALALAAAKAVKAGELYLANRTPEKARALAAQLGCRVASTEEAAKCGYVFLGVKPQMLQQLLSSLAPVLAAREDEFVLVSMAAGVTMADIQKMAANARKDELHGSSSSDLADFLYKVLFVLGIDYWTAEKWVPYAQNVSKKKSSF